jgi:hypothetical protein
MSGEGFLARWSRRKREGVEETPEAEAPAIDGAAPESPPPAAACPIPGVPEIDLASLPRIEDLTIASDLSPFLRAGVPAALRSAALRRMWSLDPAIRDYIGPVDYQWDFNTPGGLPAGFASELGGEVKKLLAQAIGLEEKEDGEAGPAEAAPPSAEAPPAAEPVEAVPMADLLPAPELPPEPPLPAPPERSQSEREALPRRRHGSALPV